MQVSLGPHRRGAGRTCLSGGRECLAYAAFTTLIGRVGAPRASVTVYFIPVVAITLGITLRGETVGVIAITGTLLILLGALLTSRKHPQQIPRRTHEPCRG